MIVELLKTFIAVTIPENPLEPVNPVITSDGLIGVGATTFGTAVVVYPKPGFIIDTEVIIPLVMLAFAVAKIVDPIPNVIKSGAVKATPVLDIGEAIDNAVLEPTYPFPPSLIVIDWIVPPAETTAVKSAALGSTDSSNTIVPILFGFS